MEVGIDVYEGIAAQYQTAAALLLHGKLSDVGQIVGSFVLGEVGNVGTQLRAQHTGNLELQIEIAEEVQLRQIQHVQVAGVLIGHHVLPVQDAPAQILHQLSRQHVDASALLIDTTRQPLAEVFAVDGVFHSEVGVVLDLRDSYTKVGIGLAIAEHSLDVGSRLLVELSVPPEELGVVVLLEVAGCYAVEVGFGSQCHRIAKETEVQVGVEVKSERTGIHARDTQLCQKVEVEGVALCSRDLATHVQTVPRVLAHHVAGGVGIVLRHLELTALVGDESLESCLHILVEPFEQGDGKGILDGEVLGFVVDGVGAIQALVVQVVVFLGEIVFGSVVGLVDAVVVVDFHRMDEARHGHVFALHRGLDGVFQLLGTLQAVQLFLRLHLDARGVGQFGLLAFARLITHDNGILGDRQEQVAESPVTKTFLPNNVEHPLLVKPLPIRAFEAFIRLSDGLLGGITVITYHKLTLNSKVCVRTVRKCSCDIGALAVMEVNTLQIKAKATHHVAKRQRQTLPHVIPMTKGKTIQ